MTFAADVGFLSRALAWARSGRGVLWLILVMLAAQAPQLGAQDAGADAYWQQCVQAMPETLGEYWRDFVPLATPDEVVSWSALDSLPTGRRSDAACAILRRAWAERAVRDGLSVEGRIALHYERLHYAREHYGVVGTDADERLGPRTRLLSAQVGRPRNAGLDDRGLLYVRLGEPDRTASFAGTQNESRRTLKVDLSISPTCYHPNVTWAYDFPDGVRLYHLSPLEGSANWWLLENLHDLYRCGDPTAAAAATVNPAVAGFSAPISEIAWLVLPDLYQSRSGLDPEYGTLSHRIVSTGPSSGDDLAGLRNVGAGALSIQQEFLRERQSSFEVAQDVLAGVLARPDVRPGLSLVETLLQFRAPSHPSGERTRVWLNAMVEGEHLVGRAVPGGGFTFAIEATFSALGETGGMHQRRALFRVRAPELGAGTGLPVRLALDLGPGDYAYSLVVRDAQDEQPRPAGNWLNDSLRVRRFDAQLPQLSDIAFAPDSGGAWSPAPDIALPVTPVNITDDAGRAWLYFEAYGLSPRGEYVTEIRLEPRGEGESFALTYPGSSPPSSEAAVRRLLRIDVTDTKPGEYDATITVTDSSGRQSLPIATTLLVR